MTVEQQYQQFVSALAEIYEQREAEQITDWVFETTAGLSRMQRSIKKQGFFSFDIEKKLDNQLAELLTNRPVQYVLGEAFFLQNAIYRR